MPSPMKRVLSIFAVGGLVAVGVSASTVASATPRNTPSPHQHAQNATDAAAIAAIRAQQNNRIPTVSWWPLESGTNARSIIIRVSVRGHACQTGKAHVSAHETQSTISITVHQPYRTSGVCLANLLDRSYSVPLATPINGRQIEGAGLWWPKTGDLYLENHQNGVGIPRVPRVLGFSANQAFDLLQAQGFKGILKNALTHKPDLNAAVTAQSPGRGDIPKDTRATTSGFAGTVTLTTKQ